MLNILEQARLSRSAVWTHQHYAELGSKEIRLHFMASGSPNRAAYIRAAYPGMSVYNVSASEPNSEDPIQAVYDKLTSGVLEAGVFMLRVLPSYSAHSVSAADVMHLYPDPNEPDVFRRKTKPVSLEELLTNLVALYRAGRNLNPHFKIAAFSSAFDLHNRRHTGVFTEETTISYDPDKLYYYFLAGGIDGYVDLFRDYYLSKGIQNFTPSDVSGGIPLEFLHEYGVTTAIDGAKRGTEGYSNNLLESLRISMIGISPRLPIFDHAARERLRMWQPKQFSHLREREAI